MRFSALTFLGIAAAWSAVARGEDSATAPRPTPLTRPEMKQALEDLKAIKPRIPLPELTEEEKEKAKTDERATSYEGRLRSLYAPGSGGARPVGTAAGSKTGGRGGRDQDPKMTLDYAFKTELFWIVSRTNNCHY
ncbi:MAG: hypothetical protein ACKVP0_25965 [Pirellulaceae bacterium]